MFREKFVCIDFCLLLFFSILGVTFIFSCSIMNPERTVMKNPAHFSIYPHVKTETGSCPDISGDSVVSLQLKLANNKGFLYQNSLDQVPIRALLEAGTRSSVKIYKISTTCPRIHFFIANQGGTPVNQINNIWGSNSVKIGQQANAFIVSQQLVHHKLPPDVTQKTMPTAIDPNDNTIFYVQADTTSAPSYGDTLLIGAEYDNAKTPVRTGTGNDVSIQLLSTPTLLYTMDFSYKDKDNTQYYDGVVTGGHDAMGSNRSVVDTLIFSPLQWQTKKKVKNYIYPLPLSYLSYIKQNESNHWIDQDIHHAYPYLSETQIHGVNIELTHTDPILTDFQKQNHSFWKTDYPYFVRQAQHPNYPSADIAYSNFFGGRLDHSYNIHYVENKNTPPLFSYNLSGKKYPFEFYELLHFYWHPNKTDIYGGPSYCVGPVSDCQNDDNPNNVYVDFPSTRGFFRSGVYFNNLGHQPDLYAQVKPYYWDTFDYLDASDFKSTEPNDFLFSQNPLINNAKYTFSGNQPDLNYGIFAGNVENTQYNSEDIESSWLLMGGVSYWITKAQVNDAYPLNMVLVAIGTTPKLHIGPNPPYYTASCININKYNVNLYTLDIYGNRVLEKSDNWSVGQ